MKKREIAMVVNQIKMEDEDKSDVLFWNNKSVSERLAEVIRLRKNHYSSHSIPYPTKMVKVYSQGLM